MKKNLVISEYSKNLYSLDQLNVFNVFDLLKSNNINEINNEYKSLFKLENSSDLQEADQYVNKKNFNYTTFLIERLNSLLCCNYSRNFWDRLFSQGIIRQVTILHQIFNAFENSFVPEKYNFKILSLKNFKYFDNFEDQRNFLNSAIGHEQMFSMYVQCFYPECVNKEFVIKTNFITKKKFFYIKNKIKKLILSTTSKLLRWKNSPYSARILLLGCYFSKKNLNFLLTNSKKKISTISILRNNKPYRVNLAKRLSLSNLPDNSDRFDNFFYFSLVYLFPKHLLEGFHDNKNYHLNILSQYPDLKFIVSEAWLGHTNLNFFRAIAFEFKHIPTYYNEHNCIFHTFEGSYFDFIKNNIDKYLTFGWNSSDAKIVSTSSLFTFKEKPKSNNISYDILYVSYPVELYFSHYCSAWANCGYAGIANLNFVHSFFRLINPFLKQKITYRGYPLDCKKTFHNFNKESILQKSLEGVSFTPSFQFKGLNCRQQMSLSRIVVIDFLSTTYLEALHMNIPTICFWDSKFMTLKSEYHDYFDELIEAKIFHTTPESAAKHLNDIYNSPDKWWNSSTVQNLKNRWLNKNFDKPDVLINYLLKLSQN